MKESAARELPHRTREVALEALSGDADRELLHALVGRGTLPDEMRAADPRAGRGEPVLPRGARAVARGLGGARARGRRVAVRPRGRGRGPADRREGHPRQDRPPATRRARRADGRVRARPAVRPAAARGGLGRRGRRAALAARAPAPRPGPRGPAVARARVPVQARADPGGRLPDARDRPAHRAARQGGGVARGGVRGTRGRGGRRCSRTTGSRRTTRTRRSSASLRAGDRARQEYALDEAIEYYRELLPILGRRGERHAIALVLFKLALAFHMSLRFAEANEMYQRAFDFWTPPRCPGDTRTPSMRVATSFLPNDPDPRSAIAWPNIQLCMQLFDRLVEAGPSARSCPRSPNAGRSRTTACGTCSTFARGCGGPTASRSPRTTSSSASSASWTRTPRARRWRSTSCSRTARTTTCDATTDADAIGVRALDDRTVEFRLAAPAPYFMGVMNRPDGGPQPRHAIERDGDAWTAIGSQVVSGAFRIVSRVGRPARTRTPPRLRGRSAGQRARGSSSSARTSPTRSTPTRATSSTW